MVVSLFSLSALTPFKKGETENVYAHVNTANDMVGTHKIIPLNVMLQHQLNMICFHHMIVSSGSQFVLRSSLFLLKDFAWTSTCEALGRRHGRLMVDFCPSGQDQYNQCRETQAHHCQNQPGLLLHVLHSRS